jgi:hypothetical protein
MRPATLGAKSFVPATIGAKSFRVGASLLAMLFRFSSERQKHREQARSYPHGESHGTPAEPEA